MADRFQNPIRFRSDRRRNRWCPFCGLLHPDTAPCSADREPAEPIVLAPIHSCGFRHPEGTACPQVRLIPPGETGLHESYSGIRVSARKLAGARRRRLAKGEK